MKRVLSAPVIGAVLGVAALVALLGYGISQNQPSRSIERSLARGQRAPAPRLELPRLGAPGKGSLADYRGKVVVLNVWASWCDPCRRESPLLERWQRRIAARGGTVLGVDVLDVSSDALAFVRRYGLTYPMLKDRGGDSIKSLGVAAYPETFVIDRHGRIAATRRGPVDDSFMRQAVLPVLAERT